MPAAARLNRLARVVRDNAASNTRLHDRTVSVPEIYPVDCREIGTCRPRLTQYGSTLGLFESGGREFPSPETVGPRKDAGARFGQSSQ